MYRTGLVRSSVSNSSSGRPSIDGASFVVAVEQTRSTSRSKILTWSNSASEHARDMVLVAKPMFWGMGNHLGPFSEASDRPEGQEQGGPAVGGQEVLQEVKF